MRVVALVSGGKDSTYNMMQCVAAGHEIVALAHLRPPVESGQDELDSPMFQTVGHWAVEAIAKCMDLPLFSQQLHGKCVNDSLHYKPAEKDEVEDMLTLLQTVKDAVGVEGVSVGAILSTYQRVRVENVCARLQLTSLAYLWQRKQEELLPEMIACGVEAVLIKVAAWGLNPSKHLGKTLEEVQADLMRLKRQCQINVCGEGGEYETFTLDCPLFHKRLVLHSTSVIEDDDSDPEAPVAYLKFDVNIEEKVNSGTWLGDCCDDVTSLGDYPCVNMPLPNIPTLSLPSSVADTSTIVGAADGDSLTSGALPSLRWIVAEPPSDITSTYSQAESVRKQAELAMKSLQDQLSALNAELCDVCQVQLYVSDMSNFKLVNDVYCKTFSHGPPARACVGLNMSPSLCVAAVALTGSSTPSGAVSGADGVGHHNWRRGYLHVQSISHWAPANIGPYSQAVQASPITWVAGQIGLVPGTMSLVRGGWQAEGELALRHAGRVLEVHNASLEHCALVTAFVTQPEALHHVQAMWDRACDDKLSVMIAVLVPALPRDAAIEWQVVAVDGELNVDTSSADHPPSTGNAYHVEWTVHTYTNSSCDADVNVAVFLARVVSRDNSSIIALEEIATSLWLRCKDLVESHSLRGSVIQAQLFVEETCNLPGLRNVVEAMSARHFLSAVSVLVVPVQRHSTGFLTLQLLLT